MLTYLPPDRRPAPPTYERPWMLLLLAFVWLWPGIFGRDLWGGEAALFATVERVARNGDWLYYTPTLAPIYLWCSVLFLRIFEFLSPYDAVRLTNVLFSALTITAVGGAGRVLLGRRHGRTAALVFIGSPGLLTVSHFIGSDIVILCGLCWSFYAFALSRSQPAYAASAATFAGFILSASGSLLPMLVATGIAVILACIPQWCNRAYLLTCAACAAFTLPSFLIWPLLLQQSNPQAFMLWLQNHAFVPFGGALHWQGAFRPLAWLEDFLWVALPAWPLCLWTLYYNRTHRQKQTWPILCTLWLIIFLSISLFAPKPHETTLLPALPALCIWAASQADTLKRGAAAFLNWLGISVFGFLALFIWLGFFAMNFGWPTKLAARSAYFSPYYSAHINHFALIVAGLFSLIWLAAITRRYVRGRQALTNWTAGITLCWSLMLTLFLPWFDAAKSYRPVVIRLENAMPSSGCVSTDNRTIRLAWQQYARKNRLGTANCPYHITLKNQTVPQNFVLLAQAARPRERQEIFQLWQRQKPPFR